jgi:hypothetical protein
MAAGPRGVGQQRREPPDPPVDGDVVDLDARMETVTGRPRAELVMGFSPREGICSSRSSSSGVPETVTPADQLLAACPAESRPVNPYLQAAQRFLEW